MRSDLLAQQRCGTLGPALHELSHGESFAELLRTRFDSPGLYVLDEPESALSFSACLGLVGLVADLASTGTAQVVVATHSPVVAAVPGATVLQLDDDTARAVRRWAIRASGCAARCGSW